MDIDLKELKLLTKDLNILYVEDDDEVRQGTFNYLKKFFKDIKLAGDGQSGLEYYKKEKFDIIITDINMPKMNGLEMAENIKKINPNQNILIISAYAVINNFITSIKLGIDGYILKPVDYDQMNEVLYKICLKIKSFNDNENYKNNLEKLVKEKVKEVEKLTDEKISNYHEVLLALVEMIEQRDTYTGGHSLRVAKYSKLIAQEMGLDDNTCELVYQAGILHDIGKIAIPDSILLKPARLNNVEYEIIKEHANMGYELLKNVTTFKQIAKIIKSHHERFDGSGYPDGLNSYEIPLLSQIMGVADTFDAITTSRIYKNKKDVKDALDEINSLKNVYFSESVINAALKALDNLTIEPDISQLPVSQLEKERFSYFYKDQVTLCYNYNYLVLFLSKQDLMQKFSYLSAFKLKNFNLYNKKYGWEKGNEFLFQISNYLKKVIGKDSMVFRIHGDDFFILSKNKVDIDAVDLNKYFKNENIFYTFDAIALKEKEIHGIENIKYMF